MPVGGAEDDVGRVDPPEFLQDRPRAGPRMRDVTPYGALAYVDRVPTTNQSPRPASGPVIMSLLPAVDLPAMPHTSDPDHALRLGDLVDDRVIPDSKALEGLGSLELHGPRRTWVFSQGEDMRIHSFDDVSREGLLVTKRAGLRISR